MERGTKAYTTTLNSNKWGCERIQTLFQHPAKGTMATTNQTNSPKPVQRRSHSRSLMSHSPKPQSYEQPHEQLFETLAKNTYQQNRTHPQLTPTTQNHGLRIFQTPQALHTRAVAITPNHPPTPTPTPTPAPAPSSPAAPVPQTWPADCYGNAYAQLMAKARMKGPPKRTAAAVWLSRPFDAGVYHR